MIFSALAHPVFYLLLAIEATAETPFLLPSGLLGVHVWLVGLFNIAFCYLASMALSLIAFKQKGARFMLHIAFMPAYWLLISLAAYRALGQIITRPFHWEKMEHGVSRYVDKSARTTRP